MYSEFSIKLTKLIKRNFRQCLELIQDGSDLRATSPGLISGPQPFPHSHGQADSRTNEHWSKSCFSVQCFRTLASVFVGRTQRILSVQWIPICHTHVHPLFRSLYPYITHMYIHCSKAFLGEGGKVAFPGDLLQFAARSMDLPVVEENIWFSYSQCSI